MRVVKGTGWLDLVPKSRTGSFVEYMGFLSVLFFFVLALFFYHLLEAGTPYAQHKESESKLTVLCLLRHMCPIYFTDRTNYESSSCFRL